MNLNMFIAVIVIAGNAVIAKEQDKVKINVDYPKPSFDTGGPREITRPLYPAPSPNDSRCPIIEVPVGCNKILSRGCKVTSSDQDPSIGDISFITDGDKEHDASTYVELGAGVQWVQIDLTCEHEIYAMCVWHFHGESRIYYAVIGQISNDPEFVDGVTTVFNNDTNNIAWLGAGKDEEYRESRFGRLFAVNAVKGRYVRFYSRGNTSNPMNHYTEIEVYGKAN